MKRTDLEWAVRFCQGYFEFREEVVLAMASRAGVEILRHLWMDFGEKVYESCLYLLREELYRSSHAFAMSQRMPAFFAALPVDGVILDYGCGTAEYARSEWYDRGRRGDLFDIGRLVYDYLEAKYKGFDNLVMIKEIGENQYDGIICLDVFEHLPNPIDVTADLVKVLKPGGQALFFFCPVEGICGHLPSSIAQLPEWEKWVFDHLSLIEAKNGLLWVEKR